MNQLLIPHQYKHLYKAVKLNLEVANRALFDVDTIKVDVDVHSSPLFQVSIDGCSQFYDFNPSKITLRQNTLVCLYRRDVHQVAKQFEVRPELLAMFDCENEMNRFDYWHQRGESRAIQFPRKECKTTPELHFGWLLTALLLDFPLEDASVLARTMTLGGVSRETWIDSYMDYPVPVLNDKSLRISTANLNKLDFAPVDQKKLNLYPVVDSVDWIEKLLRLGLTTIQLRLKDSAPEELELQIKKAAELGRQHNAQLFINDHWELAIKHRAYGVHLGQEDLSTANLELIQQAGLRVGLSTHGYYELLRALQLKPSYVALGHIFPTTTKQMPSKPQGLVRLMHYRKVTGDVPTVAIGGIDMTNAIKVLECGVTSLAVVRAITSSQNYKKVIEYFNSKIFNLSENKYAKRY